METLNILPFLKELDNQINGVKKLWVNADAFYKENVDAWDSIIHSKNNSAEMRLIASVAKADAQGDKARLASQISNLYAFKMLSLHIYSLELQTSFLITQSEKLTGQQIEIEELKTLLKKFYDEIQKTYDESKKAGKDFII